MSYKSKAHLYLIVSLVIGICLSAVLLLDMRFSQAATSESIALLAPGDTIELVPDQMTLTGHVTTRENCVNPTVCSWLDDTPTGTIMLGVNPTSTDATTWNGGSVTAEVPLTDIDSPIVLVLKLSWPDRDGKGLHSPEQDRTGTITLDGQPLWGKRTTRLSTFNDHYYAAEHEPILTTIVLTQSITHTLSFSVSARTAWDLSRIELSAYPYPTTTIKGIGYSPYRDCQYPGGALQPSVQDMEEDLFRLFHTTNAIRTYSAMGGDGQIPALANAIGLSVYAGAWIDYPKTTLAQDDDEIQALIDLACTTDLEGAIVGNEYYLRHRTNDGINYLLQRIREVKDGIRDECGKDVPVTTAEIDNLMFDWENLDDFEPEINSDYHPILDEIDFIMVHTYPFWNGMSIDGAAAFTVNRYKAIQETYPGKRAIIGEAGWPSAGAPCYGENGHSGEAGWPSADQPQGPAMPSLKNQRCYLLEFLSLAEQEGVEYMYFDAFDELWKIEEPGRVGQNWGYSYSDRTAKHDFYGVLLPTEQLPESEHCSSYVVYLPYIASSGGSQTFPVYTEWPMGPGYFVPSGWMGDIENIGMYECDRADPHGGEMAIRASFSPTGTLGLGGVYWQYPEKNWGDMEDGLNLSWANKLRFWARGTKGEKIRFFVGGIGTKDDPYPDSLRPALSTGFIQLEDEWREYMIDLREQDLTHVIGGFGWATDQCANPSGATFYLDDIVFEFDPDMPPPPPPGPVFPVYTDAAAQDNHYFPTGWMGDGEVSGRMSLTECWYDNPHSGQTAIKIAYTEYITGWAGIYWLHPSENWGDRPGGFDLTGADRLTFWARSDPPNTKIKFLMGGIWGQYPDSQQPALSTDVVTLTQEWSPYSIDLRGRDLSQVIGGFGFVTDQCLNTEPITFYLDDIHYIVGGDPGAPTPTPTPETPYTLDVYRDRDMAGNHYVPSGWMGDTGDIILDECWRGDTHTGSTAIRVEYTAEGNGPHYGCDGPPPCDWAGVYWQDPANNWGDRPGGYDLSGARGVTFWAKGEDGGEWISFKVGGIGCESSAYPDSLCPVQALDPAPVSLTNTWRVYTIPLNADLNLSSVVGGFLWAASRGDNPDGATFYLDDVQYLFNVDIPLQPHWIYHGPRLADGYDMGVNTSGGLTDWLTDMGGYMRMDYPGGGARDWGAVFITVGPPTDPPRPSKDLSNYRALSLELRGEVGGEDVWVGLKDNTDRDDGSERKFWVRDLTTDWQAFTFPLSDFVTADLTRLYVVTEFVFEPNTPAETVYFRHIQYLP